MSDMIIIEGMRRPTKRQAAGYDRIAGDHGASFEWITRGAGQSCYGFVWSAGAGHDDLGRERRIIAACQAADLPVYVFGEGQRVGGGEPGTEDYDEGVVHQAKGATVLVGWESGVTTWSPCSDLRPL